MNDMQEGHGTNGAQEDLQKDRTDPSRTFRLQELIDASPAIISVIDPGCWQVCYQNRTGQTQLGPLVGHTCFDHIAHQPAVCGFCKATEAVQTGTVTASEVPRPDGRWFLVQWAPIRSTDNRVFALETITEITETKRREQEYLALKQHFEQLASRDALTGLLNRRGWLAQAQRRVDRAAHDAAAVGILMVDIDRFKHINDTWGHLAGDDVIVEVGRRLVRQCRPDDLVGRWGGEEFVVLLHPPVGDLRKIAERVVRAVRRQPIAVPGAATRLPVTISVGATAAVLPAGEPQALERLVDEADRQLLAAKAQGRNQAVVAPIRPVPREAARRPVPPAEPIPTPARQRLHERSGGHPPPGKAAHRHEPTSAWPPQLPHG
ncbi:diguanylate cyclase [Nitrospira sp. Kam-Ns4a]